MARILVVDDDASIRDVYTEVLEGEGYLVETAINGEEALFKLRQGGYDLTFLDIMMPQIDGIGVLDGLIAQPPKQPNGPVIILTNLGQDPLTNLAKDKGIHSYLIKASITPGDVVTAARKALETTELKKADYKSE